MAKYFLTNKAVEDLSQIWDYTYEFWSENQADKYYELLIETCQELSKNPGVGKGYPEIENGVLGFRVSKHIIFYRLAKLNEIVILRVLHGREDLKNRMNE